MIITFMKNKKELLIGAIVVLAFSILFPVLLNAILPLRTIKVIGDEALWLMFWGDFIGAIASLSVAFLTYRTLLHYQKSQSENERLEYYKNQCIWLSELRRALSELLNRCDLSVLGDISEKIEYGLYDEAVNESNIVIVDFKKANFEVSSLLLTTEDTAEYGLILSDFQKSTLDIAMAFRGIAINARHKGKDEDFKKSFRSYLSDIEQIPDFELIKNTALFMEQNKVEFTPGAVAYWAFSLGGRDLDNRYNKVLDIYSREAERVEKLQNSTHS